MLQNVIKKARIAPLLALLALSSLGVWAQSTQGGVHGAVTDASGAAVPNAKVTLTNEGTNEARNSTTNSAQQAHATPHYISTPHTQHISTTTKKFRYVI